LPAYRGAAPIHWAVINGEKETGVTTFFLKHEIDTGDMLIQAKLEIGSEETTGEVHDRMMQMGANVVLESVKKIESGDYTLQPQDDSKVSKAPKIHPETCKINFDQNTDAVFNFIRGMSPFPAAWTTIDGLNCKIYKAKKGYDARLQEPGSISTDGKKFLRFFTLDGFIEVEELKLQGKRKMGIKDFLNGYKFENI
jgi:methionyl-tRNA formyltransferase